eukprot:4722521-Pleurochrysis_carterae.AAC.2
MVMMIGSACARDLFASLESCRETRRFVLRAAHLADPLLPTAQHIRIDMPPTHPCHFLRFVRMSRASSASFGPRRCGNAACNLQRNGKL